MKELSLHLLDIVQNSVKAEAKNITITLKEDAEADLFSMSIEDDGIGMDAEFLKNVLNPFVTTRTTRPVGLGLPLLHLAARQTGGDLEITSAKGVGTALTARFGLSHLDRPPLGDVADTLCALLGGNDDIHFIYEHTTDRGTFRLDTDELRGILGPVPLSDPAVLSFLSGYLAENLEEIGV